MTVSAQTPYNVTTANGVSTVFAYQFKILAAADLQVYVAGVLKTLNVDYSVSGVGVDVGGSVTFLLGAPAAAAVVSIIRAMTAKRTTDYQQLGDFLTPVVNPDFDNAILLIQDVQTQLGRSIRTPADEVGTLPTLPSITDRAGKYVAFDSNGLPIASSGTGTDTALRTDLATTTSGADGSRLLGYRRADAGSVAETIYNVLRREVWVEDFGGAPGSADNTGAMNLAAAALNALGGGFLRFGTPGTWKMNWTCLYSNIVLVGFGGNVEFDGNSSFVVRTFLAPFSLASPTLTFGDGTNAYRYCGLLDIHVSGANGTWVSVSDNAALKAAYNATHAVRLRGGMINFQARNCYFYNGIRTISLEPSALQPITGTRFVGGGVRNDLSDSTSARAIYGERLADPGFYTDNLFELKVNGPSQGYAGEFFNNGGAGIAAELNGYWDIRNYCGVLLRGSALIRGGQSLDLDPGSNGAVIIETDQVQADPSRVITGIVHHGGQKIQFSGTVIDSGTAQAGAATTITLRAAATFVDNELTGYTVKITGGLGSGQIRTIASNVGATDVVTVSAAWATNPNATSTYAIYKTIDLPAEADDYTYQQRLLRAFLGPQTFITSLATPFATNVSWDFALGTPNTLTLTGTDLYVRSLRVSNTDCVLEYFESDQGADGKLWLARVSSATYKVQTRTDAGGSGKDAILVSRTGTAIAGVELGNSTDLAPNTLHGHLKITDGVTAPATAVGFGSIYIDAADGDLKIKFGDGTVKTIVVDT